MWTLRRLAAGATRQPSSRSISRPTRRSCPPRPPKRGQSRHSSASGRWRQVNPARLPSAGLEPRQNGRVTVAEAPCMGPKCYRSGYASIERSIFCSTVVLSAQPTSTLQIALGFMRVPSSRTNHDAMSNVTVMKKPVLDSVTTSGGKSGSWQRSTSGPDATPAGD